MGSVDKGCPEKQEGRGPGGRSRAGRASGAQLLAPGVGMGSILPMAHQPTESPGAVPCPRPGH